MPNSDDLPPEGLTPRGTTEVGERDGQFALLIDGVVQSVRVDGPEIGRGYWPAMLPDTAPRSALILGLGGGTVAHLLHHRFGPLPILGVDENSRVLELGRVAFALDRLPQLRIEEGDAFAFVAALRERFDLVVVDLFKAGEVPREVTGTSFLRDVRRLLASGGLATFNLARDRRAASRVHRLGKVFVIEKQVLTGFNVVVHCRLPNRTVRSR